MSLTVENMSFSYGKHPVLHELTFTAEAGELLAILGPNGVGKTTLFKCVMGQERKYSGRIAADGADLAALTPWCSWAPATPSPPSTCPGRRSGPRPATPWRG